MGDSDSHSFSTSKGLGTQGHTCCRSRLNRLLPLILLPMAQGRLASHFQLPFLRASQSEVPGCKEQNTLTLLTATVRAFVVKKPGGGWFRNRLVQRLRDAIRGPDGAPASSVCWLSPSGLATSWSQGGRQSQTSHLHMTA